MESRLPPQAQAALGYLHDAGFILPSPSAKSLELRELAAEYADTIVKTQVVKAVFLSGSAVVGNAGGGSDIDVTVVVDGASTPLRKYVYKHTPVDLDMISYGDWEARFIHGDCARFLTHSIPLYDPDGTLLMKQQLALEHYYSDESYRREYARVEGVLTQRTASGTAFAAKGAMALAAIPLESCFYEALNLLVYRHRGMPSTSLLLSELRRIGHSLRHDDWFDRAVEFMRFDLEVLDCAELLDEYNELFDKMRERMGQARGVTTRLAGLEMGIFNAGRDIVELCSETNYQQLQDKVERAVSRREKHNAGLALFYESNYNFFMFSPFFYLKNVNGRAEGADIAALPFEIIFDSWDDDIKGSWRRVSRTAELTQAMLAGLVKLTAEVFAECRP